MISFPTRKEENLNKENSSKVYPPQTKFIRQANKIDNENYSFKYVLLDDEQVQNKPMDDCSLLSKAQILDRLDKLEKDLDQSNIRLGLSVSLTYPEYESEVNILEQLYDCIKIYLQEDFNCIITIDQTVQIKLELTIVSELSKTVRIIEKSFMCSNENQANIMAFLSVFQELAKYLLEIPQEHIKIQDFLREFKKYVKIGKKWTYQRKFNQKTLNQNEIYQPYNKLLQYPNEQIDKNVKYENKNKDIENAEEYFVPKKKKIQVNTYK